MKFIPTSFKVMKFCMFFCCKKLQVFKTIITSIMINVMNIFEPFKFSTDAFFHYRSMLKNQASIKSNLLVSRFKKATRTTWSQSRFLVWITINFPSSIMNITKSFTRWLRNAVISFTYSFRVFSCFVLSSAFYSTKNLNKSVGWKDYETKLTGEIFRRVWQGSFTL